MIGQLYRNKATGALFRWVNTYPRSGYPVELESVKSGMLYHVTRSELGICYEVVR